MRRVEFTRCTLPPMRVDHACVTLKASGCKRCELHSDRPCECLRPSAASNCCHLHTRGFFHERAPATTTSVALPAATTYSQATRSFSLQEARFGQAAAPDRLNQKPCAQLTSQQIDLLRSPSVRSNESRVVVRFDHACDFLSESELRLLCIQQSATLRAGLCQSAQPSRTQPSAPGYLRSAS